MPVTTRNIANIGSPPDDPLLQLDAVLHIPDPILFPGPYHCFVATEAPGFQHSPGLGAPGGVLDALAELGVLGLAFRCRVDNELLPGQTTDGKWHQQTDDCKIGIRYMRPGGKIETIQGFDVTGFVGMTGGSAAAHHAVYCALDGTLGDDKVDCALGFSPPTDFSDVSTQSITGGFHTLVEAYGRGDGSGDPADLALLRSRSPIALNLAAASPIRQYNGTAESMPYAQLTGFRDAMIAAGAVGHVAITNSLPGERNKHSWDIWRFVANVQPDSIAWVMEQIANWGGNTLPPPGPKAMKGGVCSTTNGKPVNDILLNERPKLDGIALNLPWNELQPAIDVFDFTYIKTELKRIAAAGKKCIIRIGSMGGSSAIDGNTPPWVFDAIGNTKAGNPGSITDGVTDGTPVITSATADFNAVDLHRQITGTNIPGAPTYLGLIISPTAARLSSSPTSQVDVNATGTGTGRAWTIIGRPRVSGTTHDVVPGVTFNYIDQSETHTGDPETTLPVFYEPTFRKYKKRMINAVGNYIYNSGDFTPAEIAALATFGTSYSNAQTEDFNFPAQDIIDIPGLPSQLDRWLNSPTFPDYNLRGAGYTTQKMIDTAIKQADEVFPDGQTFTNKRLVSLTANFTLADVGITVIGPTGHQVKIASWTSPTEVQLDEDTLTTGTASFTMKFRRTGFFDVARAAFPGAMITSAIGQMRSAELDQAAADLAGDTDVTNFLCRTVANLLNGTYPGLIIHQKNNFTAKGEDPGQKTGTSQALLWEIRQAGFPTVGQDLWLIFGDTEYRMNGHQPGEPEAIAEAAAVKIHSFGCSYHEMYQTDGINLPDAVIFNHDLFNPDEIEPPPPPSDDLPPILPPLVLQIEPVQPNFRDAIIFGIADLLAIDPQDLSPSRAQRWVSEANRHLGYAWNLHEWPQFMLTEERPFRQVYSRADSYVFGEEVYFIGALDADGNIFGTGYYRANATVVPIGEAPTFDSALWDPFDLTSNDYYIQLLQGCRRRIGEVSEVYPTDPRNPTLGPVRTVPWQLSRRGIEVYRFSGLTVFVAYRAVPYRYSARSWAANIVFKAGELTLLDDDGEVYRAINGVTGIPPGPTTNRWAHVPFPSFLAAYVTNMVAADEAPDLASKQMFRAEAARFLAREEDLAIEEGGRPQRYRLTGPVRRRWPMAPLLTDGTSPSSSAENTISEPCVDEWGDLIP